MMHQCPFAKAKRLRYLATTLEQSIDMPQSAHSNAIVIFADAAYFPLAHILAIDAHATAGDVADTFIFTDDAALAERYAGDIGPIVQHIERSRCARGGIAGRGRISEVTYYRLFIGELLGIRQKRVLYLDCDIAVEPDFSDMFSFDLQGAALAAAIDGGDILRRHGKHATAWQQHLRDIGLPVDAPYFNAGVLLIDLDAWRQTDVVGEAFSFLADRGAHATCMDQDALNDVFRGRWRFLSQRYNFQSPFMGLGLEEIARPLIWHYSGDTKPWLPLSWPHDQAHCARFHARLTAAGWADFIDHHQNSEHARQTLWPGVEAFRAKKLAMHHEDALAMISIVDHAEMAAADTKSASMSASDNGGLRLADRAAM